MISGRVNERYEAVIPVEIASHDRRTAHRFDAIIDSGFSQYLMLPRDDVSQLGLPIVGSRTLVLGNEQRYRFDYCFTAIFWDDDIRGIPVLVSETECLVGMRLLAGNYLTAAMVPGGLVTISRMLPS